MRVRTTILGLMALASMAIGAYAQNPSVASGGVLNAASFTKGQAVTPGGLVSIFGTNLATGLAVADSVPLSTSLASTSVSFNGTAAPLLFVNHDAANGDQVNAQLPWNAGTSGNVSMVVTRNGQPSAAVDVPVAPVSPGIF